MTALRTKVGPRRGRLLAALVVLVAVVSTTFVAASTAQTVINPGPPSGNGEQPVALAGNPTCASHMGTGFLFEYKQEPVADATDIPLSNGGLNGTLDIDVTDTAAGPVFSFDFDGAFVAAGVMVKGGPNANFYDYRPAGEDADTLLHAPINPSNGKYYGLSHISFCMIVARTEIRLAKTAVASPITIGGKFEYNITVSDVADGIAATGVSITDPLIPHGRNWEIVSQPASNSCVINDSDANGFLDNLSCNVGTLADGASFGPVHVRTLTGAGPNQCNTTHTNVATATSTNASTVTDDATIAVQCGAVRLTKVVKDATTATVGDFKVLTGARFLLLLALVAQDEKTVDANGVACFENLPTNTTFTVRETVTPTGFATIPDFTVSTAGAATCAAGGGAVARQVENDPLTDLDIKVEAQVDDMTRSSINCTNGGGTSGAAFVDPAVVSTDNLLPGTYVCTIVIDP